MNQVGTAIQYMFDKFIIFNGYKHVFICMLTG